MHPTWGGALTFPVYLTEGNNGETGKLLYQFLLKNSISSNTIIYIGDIEVFDSAWNGNMWLYTYSYTYILYENGIVKKGNTEPV